MRSNTTISNSRYHSMLNTNSIAIINTTFRDTSNTAQILTFQNPSNWRGGLLETTDDNFRSSISVLRMLPKIAGHHKNQATSAGKRIGRKITLPVRVLI